MKTLILITVALFALSGCNDEQKKEAKQEIKQETSVYTVQYYLDHEDLRKVRLRECRALKKTTSIQKEDCINARKAEFRSRQNKTFKF